jgi:hypothetical protein
VRGFDLLAAKAVRKSIKGVHLVIASGTPRLASTPNWIVCDYLAAEKTNTKSQTWARTIGMQIATKHATKMKDRIWLEKMTGVFELLLGCSKKRRNERGSTERHVRAAAGCCCESVLYEKERKNRTCGSLSSFLVGRWALALWLVAQWAPDKKRKD